MEKLSLYNIMSVLLPGALLTLTIELMLNDAGVAIEDFKLNQHFTLTIFLSASIFLGSVINISTRNNLGFLGKIGLYTKISKIYLKPDFLKQIKPFFKKLIKKTYGEFNEKSIIDFWSIMYYELEATDKIKVAKTYQSFYFFFRNFFTLGILLFVLLGIQLIFNYKTKYLFLLFINVFGMLLSVLAGRWYRIKMVEKMFWTYYSLNKNKKTKF